MRPIRYVDDIFAVCDKSITENELTRKASRNRTLFDPMCCSRLGVLRGERQQYVESLIGIPDTFDLMLDNAPARRCRVTWRKATQIGVEFA